MKSDASPLIFLAKLNKLDILNKIFDNITITKSVYSEIVSEELLNRFSDAKIIDNSVKEGKIKVTDLDSKHKLISEKILDIYSQLDIGEAETIALALQQKEKDIVIAESAGRTVATLYGLKPMGILRILLIAYSHGLIDKSNIKLLVEQLIESKFRLSAEALNKFWNLFEKLEKNN